MKTRVYKSLDGSTSPWLADQRPWYQRLIWKLYKKYVNEFYIPSRIEVEFIRERQEIHPKYNQITSVLLRQPNPKGGYLQSREKRIFNDFGNTFKGHL